MADIYQASRDATEQGAAALETTAVESAGIVPLPSPEADKVSATGELTSRHIPSKGFDDKKNGSLLWIPEFESEPVREGPSAFKSLERFWRNHGTLVSIIFSGVFSATQIVVITVILVLSATTWRVGPGSDQSEWEGATNLGVCVAIWAAREAMVVLMRIWELRRFLDNTPQGIFLPGDLETSAPFTDDGLEPDLVNYAPHGSEPISTTTYTSAPQVTSWLSQRTLDTPSLCEPEPKHDMFKLFDALLSELGFIHFLVNQHLHLSTIWTIRLSAPHIWWLAVGIACQWYLFCAGILVLPLVAVIPGPIFPLFFDLFKRYIGRRDDPEWDDDDEGDDATITPEQSLGRFDSPRSWESEKDKTFPEAAIPATATPSEATQFGSDNYPPVVLAHNRTTCPVCWVRFLPIPLTLIVLFVCTPPNLFSELVSPAVFIFGIVLSGLVSGLVWYFCTFGPSTE